MSDKCKTVFDFYFCLQNLKESFFVFFIFEASHSKKTSTFALRFSKHLMAKKGNRIQVIMECTEHKNSGMPGTSRYITTKNRKNTTQRLELKKYNPILKKVTLHKEIK